MELLGENLSDLRRKQQEGCFSLDTTIRIGQQMLRAIEAIHNLGYLHRDIKPSNFAMGLSLTKKRTVFLIDFGLARRYLLPSGEVRPARDSSGFRGTARYASINSHLCKDLGRRDDLWSLFYVLIEFAKGTLPWRRVKDKDQIGEVKIQYNNAQLVKDLPKEFFLFMQHIQSLQYEDKPDYLYLHNLLQTICKSLGVNENTPLDWELSSTPLHKPSPKSHSPEHSSSDKAKDKKKEKEKGADHSGKSSERHPSGHSESVATPPINFAPSSPTSADAHSPASFDFVYTKTNLREVAPVEEFSKERGSTKKDTKEIVHGGHVDSQQKKDSLPRISKQKKQSKIGETRCKSCILI